MLFNQNATGRALLRLPGFDPGPHESGVCFPRRRSNSKLALLGLIIGLGLSFPAEARDGSKSVADGGSGKAVGDSQNESKKETEARLDQLYDEAVQAAEAFRTDPTVTEDNPYGTGETYGDYSAKTQYFGDEESAAITSKSVRKSYEPRSGQY